VNNTGFVSGDGRVLAIDSCSTEKRTRAFVDTVKKLAGRPPSMLLNTHHHGDHTNGNCLIDDATIIGHERCREEMLKAGILRLQGVFEPVEWGELKPDPPFVTFGERLDVHLGGLRVELCHVGTAAHTTNDVFAWIPERKVLFTGDLVFNGGTPFVLMGSVSGSLLALDLIAELEPEVIVPGHGEVCTTTVVDEVGEYLRFLQRVAGEAKRAGFTPLEAAREVDLAAEGFDDLLEPERLAGNLHRALAECEGARPGDPIDIAAAFADMIEMNGGRPLSCLA
jgi:cyclase